MSSKKNTVGRKPPTLHPPPGLSRIRDRRALKSTNGGTGKKRSSRPLEEEGETSWSQLSTTLQLCRALQS